MIDIVEKIKSRQSDIYHWLEKHETLHDLPLYSSVDIRDAGFKAAVVDTNLFPAGFNNLCEHGINDSVEYLKNALLRRSTHCRRVLIIAEEHTRNTWYLENIRILKEIISRAGFETDIATFLSVQPSFCEDVVSVELKTATDSMVRICCFKRILEKIKNGTRHYDLIILNNDLTSGIPDVLLQAGIPIYPSMQAGWHSRLKSHHFLHTADLMKEFGRLLNIDPWLLTCFDAILDSIDINSEEDRKKIVDHASDLMSRIRSKYEEHGICEKPFLFLKSDSGTYGMGVLAIESAQDLLHLNRKMRNKLAKGKNSKPIHRFLLQEGVPTMYHIENKVSEVCIYQIENNLVGGFYRSHFSKSNRENLNSVGMDFQKMCPHQTKYGDCGVHHDMNIFDVYRILSRIAAIAAHREIQQLETVQI